MTTSTVSSTYGHDDSGSAPCRCGWMTVGDLWKSEIGYMAIIPYYDGSEMCPNVLVKCTAVISLAMLPKLPPHSGRSSRSSSTGGDSGSSSARTTTAQAESLGRQRQWAHNHGAGGSVWERSIALTDDR
jgi:hypothetical protein